MRIAAIIPARYDSSRLKGKPLADLCGRPMIWWVYSQVKKSNRIHEVVVATDSEEIRQVCQQYGLACVMTSRTHRTSTERIYEAAQKIPADVYLCVNGDEPLIEPGLVEQVIPGEGEAFFAANLMAKIHNPVEVVDDTNIKVVTDEEGNALFMTRSPIPHPKASTQFCYYKHLGVLAYSMEALRFFSETGRGKVERIEDINELRFIEHGKKLRMIPVEAQTLSVDTPRDLDFVRNIIQEKLERGEVTL
ncbi:3-deoxy-manno-octulosonate cytidylyltransferase [Bianquea renquensis]|jgi:3-deoxy-D-manno-octulosonate cytidylyltransferase|uniref:3-deoxy-manno-octulosonate cytidylyltransferase n=1 Tax=Bianquea renquensis TaxID=2763661 RepID=A0A926DTE2_9FIRM|nr:3-deoxy-manno-octulosonate cytidylyltransferase [Bianquea renquensis]MBC8544958.1 3-deoxy-manno-octulosonate cytidylyltransferase [Bianquea renquensis]